jgi:RNA-directed DNA polymerase
VKAVEKRLREEFAKLGVEINEEKSRMVDLTKGESFCFLGFEYRRILSRNKVWRPQYVPRLKKRTALLAKLREIFRRYVSQPAERVIELINPILRGWVNYFAVGHSSRCFSFIQDWVDKKIRRHLMRARQRSGFGDSDGTGGVDSGSMRSWGSSTSISFVASNPCRKPNRPDRSYNPCYEARR